MKILLVDHSIPIRRVEAHILECMGYTEIKHASDGAEALKMLLVEDFGFVISDWDLPDMKGLDLLKSIRSYSRLKTIPVLMVLDEMEIKTILMAGNAGVNSLIVKPFSLKTLQEKIDALFPVKVGVVEISPGVYRETQTSPLYKKAS